MDDSTCPAVVNGPGACNCKPPCQLVTTVVAGQNYLCNRECMEGRDRCHWHAGANGGTFDDSHIKGIVFDLVSAIRKAPAESKAKFVAELQKVLKEIA